MSNVASVWELSPKSKNLFSSPKIWKSFMLSETDTKSWLQIVVTSMRIVYVEIVSLLIILNAHKTGRTRQDGYKLYRRAVCWYLSDCRRSNDQLNCKKLAHKSPDNSLILLLLLSSLLSTCWSSAFISRLLFVSQHCLLSNSARYTMWRHTAYIYSTLSALLSSLLVQHNNEKPT